jgi:hypothetical protein
MTLSNDGNGLFSRIVDSWYKQSLSSFILCPTICAGPRALSPELSLPGLVAHLEGLMSLLISHMS